jgi:hypothetical protein
MKKTMQHLALSRETIQRLDNPFLFKILKGGVVCPRPDSMSGNLVTDTCASTRSAGCPGA